MPQPAQTPQTPPKQLGPKLRDDLVLVEKIRQGKRLLVIKDPIAAKYYQFGEVEITLFRLMDGKTPPPKMIESLNAAHSDVEMTMDDLKEFLGDIDKMHLLEKSLTERNALLLERLKEERANKLMSKKGSIMFKRFPLVDPNDFFDRIHPYITWIWSKPFVGFMCLVILAACVAIGYNWDDFTDGITSVFAFYDRSLASIFWLWLTIVGVIMFHELGHGLTCKHYGGEVHEMGFLLLFFQPCFYANVTDAYMFKDKKHKLFVTFAGILVEFFIGSIFCFVWLLTDEDTSVNAICYQAMTVCGISSVLFNLNPLVKYDGYYAFSEWVDLPNLKQNSGDALESFCQRIYKKADEFEDDGLTKRERTIYILYTIASNAFILSMLGGLFLMVKDTILEATPEIGIFAFSFVVWKLAGGQIRAVWKFFKDFYQYEEAHAGAIKVRFVALALVAAAAGLAFTMPYDITVDKKVTVEAGNKWTVRAPIEGFLQEMYVRTGDEVKPGQALFVIANPEMSRKLSDLGRETRKYEMQRDQAVASEDPGKLQEIRIHEQQTELDRRAILQDIEKTRTGSTVQGTVLTKQPQELKGKYYKKGDVILDIVDLSTLYSVVQLEERDAGAVRDARAARMAAPGIGPTRTRLKVNALPGRLFQGSILSVDPIADTSGVIRTFKAKIVIPNPDFSEGGGWMASGMALRPGMTGVARLDIMESTPFGAFKRWLSGFFRMDLFVY